MKVDLSKVAVFCCLLILCFTHPASTLKRSKRSIFIASGTLWCGAGNNAATCDDLGEYAETDKCCREHDACPYTFSFNQPPYNGFYSLSIYSVSHCECDSIFYNCLHEKPYKPNSFVIWESFASIGVKCFAYLPCSTNESDAELPLWKHLGERQTGACTNGSRVAVFDSIFDYYDYLNATLDAAQSVEIRRQLLTKSDRFYSERKRRFKCNYMFANLTRKLAYNFEMNFLDKFPPPPPPPTLPTLPTTIKTTTTTTNIINNITIAIGNTTTTATTRTTKIGRIFGVFGDEQKNESQSESTKTAVSRFARHKKAAGGKVGSPKIRTDSHEHVSYLEYPILITCLVLSFVLFAGLFLIVLV